MAHAAVTIVLMEVFLMPIAAIANIFGTVTGTTISYFGNKAWTFGATGGHDYHLPRFLAAYAFVTALNGLIMYFVSDLAGVYYVYPMVVLFVLSPVLTFFLNRAYVFESR